ncbi:MAG: radical SAM protein [Deltaproteobacteria bacterium]|nr:radical SAM protein [Deltaproteobacteria bacterium]
MTDLPRALREALAAEYGAEPDTRLAAAETSADGTTKVVVALPDGGSTETVLIPEALEELDDDPLEPEPSALSCTLCLSSQVGCAFHCAFCRSGSRGFGRHLEAREILAQLHWARVALGGRGNIVRLVLMGIGEPLHNLDGVLPALRLLTDPRAAAFSGRRVTVSTIGLPEGIRRLGETFGGKVALAWSLHAADEATRRRLLPVAARRPVAETVEALRDYPLPPRRRITVECVLAGGVNDTDGHAREVVRLLEGLRCKLNLIPFNPWAGTDGAEAPAATADGEPLRPPAPGRVEAFQRVLAAAGLSAFVRRPRGADILAACGQLLGSADLSRGGRWDS